MKSNARPFSKKPEQHSRDDGGILLEPNERKLLNGKIDQYRGLLKDKQTADYVIQKRIEYLEALCRNVIREELKKL